MTAQKRRGRPRKKPFFKNGAPRAGNRPITALGQVLKAGQKEFVAELRRSHQAGPYVSASLLMEAVRYDHACPKDDLKRVLAEDALVEARSRALALSHTGGRARASRNREVKKEIVGMYHSTFERVRNGTLRANSGAEHIHSDLERSGSVDWVPSVRTLNSWLSEYKEQNLAGAMGKEFGA